MGSTARSVLLYIGLHVLILPLIWKIMIEISDNCPKQASIRFYRRILQGWGIWENVSASVHPTHTHIRANPIYGLSITPACR